MLPHLKSLAISTALAAAALVAALLSQGLLLFRNPLTNLVEAEPAQIRCLAITDDGRRPLVLVRELSGFPRALSRYALYCSFERAAVPLPVPLRGLAPFCIAAAPCARFAFFSTSQGALYSFDASADAPQPIYLGKHQESFPTLVACSDDGQILIAANLGSVSGWDRAGPRCLWRRDDIGLHCGAFLPGTHRFMCSGPTGRIVELDSRCGVAVGDIPSHCFNPVIGLDFSADGCQMAAIDGEGTCVVSLLPASQPLWSKQFAPPPVTPRFTPDGRLLVAADPHRLPRVVLLSATSGDLLGELIGAAAEIAGVAVTRQGIVYAWDWSGAVTAWDLSSRAMLFQFYPGRST
jgi:hypothetical protein